MRISNWLQPIVLCVFGIGSSLFGASIIPTYTGSVLNGAFWDHSYDLNLSPGSKIGTTLGSSFFTLYDPDGFQSASLTGANAANWVLSFNNLGPNGALTAPTDNASKLNVTATYNSSTIITGPNTLVTLIIKSAFQNVNAFGQYTGQDYNGVGTIQGNAGFVSVPEAPQQGIPEPMTFVLMGAGLVGIAALRRRED